MALLAEELVEEWLRRQGFFTIRGARLGVHEIDLLAVRHADGDTELRHVEVQASVRPIGYISSLPIAMQRDSGKKARSVVKRDAAVLAQGVSEWIDKKYNRPEKRKLLERLWPGDWVRELVVHRVREVDELECIRAHGINVFQLSAMVRDLQQTGFVLERAAGSDFADLLALTD
jgi:hypothetical protein